MKAIITQGIAASGKSTWAKAFCKENKEFVRISRDDLRRMRGEYFIKEDEVFITECVHSLIKTAFKHGKNVVIDETSINHRFHTKMKAFLIEVGYEIEIKRFDISLEEALERNSKRAADEIVADHIVKRMFKEFKKYE